MRPEDLDPETQEQLNSILKTGEVELLQLSCTTSEGVMNVRNSACDRLLAARNAEKLKAGTNSSGEPTGRLGDLLRRIHVAQPMGGVTRETSIPEAVLNKKKYDRNDPDRPKLERDIEEEEGGAGVYNFNMRKNYILENDEWKEDRIPEVYDGKNVYDFIDPDIEAKLAALEEEEEKLEAEGFYESDSDVEDAEEAEIRHKAELIREKRQLIRNEAKMRKSLKNRAQIPRSAKAQKLSKMESHLESLGYDSTKVADRARSQSRGRSILRERSDGIGASAGADAMDIDTPGRIKSRGREPSTNRRLDGVPGDVTRSNAERLAKLSQKKMNRMARQGEADRHQTGSLIKHLVSLWSLCAFLRNVIDRICRMLTCIVGCWQAWHGQDGQALSISCCRRRYDHEGSTGSKKQKMFSMFGVFGVSRIGRIDTIFLNIMRAGTLHVGWVVPAAIEIVAVAVLHASGIHLGHWKPGRCSGSVDRALASFFPQINILCLCTFTSFFLTQSMCFLAGRF